MAIMAPKSIRPLPKHYYSPTYRGASTDTSGALMSDLYKSRKMGGTLGGLFNILLAGERASGSLIYGARKSMGFGSIDWIEQAESGGSTGYRRISPSEALGMKGYNDKFWTGRGIASFVTDVVLDPTTYIGVGLIGKGGKAASIASKGFTKRTGVEIGEAGAEFIMKTQARGISRGTAERKLFEYMGRSPAVQAEMTARTGESAIMFGTRYGHVPLMKTARITGPMGKAWRAAPFMESRTHVLESAKQMFKPFHRIKSQVGPEAGKPFEEYYRAVGTGRSKWDQYVYGMSKDVPTEWHAPMVRYLDTGVEPTSHTAEIIAAAQQYKHEVGLMGKAEIGAGVLKPGAMMQNYYARVPTEEAMRYVEKQKLGIDFGAGLTREEMVSKYMRSLGAANQRTVRGSIFEAEEAMTKHTGVKEWYVMNPYESLQRRGISSIMSLESARLKETIKSTMGVRAVPETVSRFVEPPIGGRLPSLVKGYKLQQQERAIQSLRDIVSAGGDIEKINLPHALQSLEIEKRQVFGGLRPEGMAPAEWIRGRFGKPISEYHRYKKEIWELEKESVQYEGEITRELGRRVISRADLMGFEKSVGLAQGGIRHRESMMAGITSGLRAESGALSRELIDPAERAAIKYRKAYETEIGKIPGGRYVTTNLPIEQQKWIGGEFHKLEGGYYIPSEAISEYTRRIPTTGWFSRLETKFKTTLTSIWPGFHARNLYGMVLWQNVLAGVSPKDYAMNLDIMRKTSPWMQKHASWAVGDVDKLYDIPFMGQKTAAQLRRIAEKREVYGITGKMDVTPTYTTAGSGVVNWFKRGYEKVPQEVMIGVESMGRGPLFWNRIMKGLPVEMAGKDVEKFHFRYGQGAMTEFEDKHMRHAFLFYRWMRGNIPLQAQMSLEKPYMYAGLGKLQARGSTPDERAQMTDWQQERFGFTMGGNFTALDIPFYEHPALVGREDLYFGLTPALKLPIGILAKRDPATGRPIETGGDVGEYALSQLAGRGVYAQRELAKTWSGERSLGLTAAHQIGGIGIYELNQPAAYTGMTSAPRMPGAVRKMGMSQDDWTQYQLARGWKPRLTDQSRAEIYQSHGGVCSVCGRTCDPEHPCRSQLIVPVEDGGTYSQENTALVCDSCAGTFRRNVAPMMAASIGGMRGPEYTTDFAERDKIWRVVDSYMENASLVE